MTRAEFMRKLAALNQTWRVNKDCAIRNQDKCCPIAAVYLADHTLPEGLTTPTQCNYHVHDLAAEMGLPWKVAERIMNAADGGTRGPIRRELYESCGLANSA